MTTSITVIGIYAGLCVSDLAAATDWYTRFMGRAPDDRPLPTMVQWRAGLQLWQKEGEMGPGVATVVVEDLSVERRRLQEAGITIGPESRGDFGAVAQVSDPDGNRIALAEPPAGFARS
jgi:predicted enzyme related to lactoylglutathione lyase